MNSFTEPSNHNNQRKVAVINDFCGFGRCSSSVAIPILSVMKLQCCVLPTAVFSNHTGYSSFFSMDFTPYFSSYIDEWNKLHLEFDGIQIGYLGSSSQIDLIKIFFKQFKSNHTRVLIDPVMGDDGTTYRSYDPNLVQRMRELLPYANIITPNLTEACLLTDTKYKEDMSDEELLLLCHKLNQLGPDKIVISGLRQNNYLRNFVFETGKHSKIISEKKIGISRAGTGDVFSAILTADLVNNVPFSKSVQKAADFIEKSILKTQELGLPATDGICIEEYLWELGQN